MRGIRKLRLYVSETEENFKKFDGIHYSTLVRKGGKGSRLSFIFKQFVRKSRIVH